MSFDALPFPGLDARPTDAVGHHPLDSSLAFQTPRLISDVSAWIQHIPFAFSLMEMLRPRRLVELGTYKGDSYCAFCQAVDMLQLETECTAIDTWAGDPQSGIYDESVLQTLAAYHDPLYGGFSKLLCSTFDEAAPQFADGSIDLLHLDGLHNYAAVRHDFETWRSKLSEGAVVLLHDINVRHGDFGVYKLWEELSPHYAHFEFLHGYGLGVLLVGRNVPARVQRFVAAAGRSPDSVRRYFHALGQRLELGRGMALLTGDVARQAVCMNAWKSERNQAQRDPLPKNFVVGSFLDGAPSDVKRSIDRIHETSMNHVDDMKIITTDNKNLLRQVEELRALENSVVAIHEGQLSDRREFASLHAELTELSNTLVLMREEVQRLHQMNSPAPRRTLLQKLGAFLESLSG